MTAQGTSRDEVAFLSSRPGEVVVPIIIGDTGPHRFLLDTGSSHSAVTQAVADRLGLAPVAKVNLTTSVGSVWCAVIRLTDVAIGSTRVDELLATALPRTGTDALGPDVDGVIGQDFLSRFNFTLDYGRSRLVWRDPSPAPAAVRLALEPAAGRLLVRLPQEPSCDCGVRLVPDSGADGIVLFDPGATTRLPIDARGRGYDVTSLAGSGTARAVTVKQLHVGQTVLRSLPAAVVRVDLGEPDRGDGLLPLHLFARVHFNNAEGFMWLE
jgi:predicted aspartyl protease